MNFRRFTLLACALTLGCSSSEDPPAAGSDASVDAPASVDSAAPDSPAPIDAAEDVPGAIEASSVTQHGITWTFDKPYPIGTFVTGDRWVVGPVKVISVSPTPTSTRNGSMLNPNGKQAYDARAGQYDGSKAVTFPITLTPTQSLVSSISHPDASECSQGGTPGWKTYDGDCQRGPIHTQAILTAVAAPLPADTFRPPYAGTDKPLHRANAACWGLLPKLPVPAGVPPAAELLRHVERPWIDHLDSWTMQHGCATHNMFCYGREIGNIVSTIAVSVLLDRPEQRELATRFIQLGIDNYGVVKSGGGWGADGGHYNGRKWPIVFAGGMLNDAGMKSPGLTIGNEDQQTYAGKDGKALFGRACTSCYLANGCMSGGSCTSGAKDCRDPMGVVDGCDDYRNCCTSLTWVGEALAARILRLDDEWGHKPFFDYVDRWMNGGVEGGGATSAPFVTELWTKYRTSLPAAGACP